MRYEVDVEKRLFITEFDEASKTDVEKMRIVLLESYSQALNIKNSEHSKWLINKIYPVLQRVESLLHKEDSKGKFKQRIRDILTITETETDRFQVISETPFFEVIDEAAKDFGSYLRMLATVDETQDTVYISTRFLVDLRNTIKRWVGEP